jgi:CRP/FNR family transcriptional regulator, polysaccharide utilization system transcription regulator
LALAAGCPWWRDIKIQLRTSLLLFEFDLQSHSRFVNFSLRKSHKTKIINFDAVKHKVVGMLNSDAGVKEILENPRSIFSLLNQEEKGDLLKHISISGYKKNEFVFKESDRPSGMLMLVDGKVKIYKEGVGGREQIIRMAKPFGLIGIRAFFADQNHIASAVTLEESKICCVSHEFIYNNALKNYDFSVRLIHKLSKELGFAYSRVVTLTQKHIRGRLAESLLLLKDKYGVENDGITLRIFLSREDIANLSNMTTSNAIRTLSTFASEKVITIDGRKIKILDPKRLERISRLG